MPITYVDIETRSAADLKKTGPYVYSSHATTEITIIAWATDNGPVEAWLPPRFGWNPAPAIWESEGYRIIAGGPLPDALRDALDHELIAHNVGFERTLLPSPAGLRIGLPASLKDVSRWDCTAARAAAVGLPRSLDGACKALGLPIQKDTDGHKLMLRMCKPRKPRKADLATLAPGQLLWVDDDASMLREAVYCCRDVEAERAIHRVVPRLSPDERATWETTEQANDAGAPVDLDLLAAMPDVIDAAQARVDSMISARTWGMVPRVSDHGALTRWLLSAGIDDHVGEDGKGRVGKQAVAAMIENPDMDPFIREVLCIRRDGGGVSPKKWRAILQRVSPDGTLKGAMVYCGAASTGRWASRGAQLHNLPRGGSIKDVDGAVRDVLSGANIAEIEFVHGPPLVVASELLRPAFKARGDFWIARGDYSQIEARVNPWLAGAAWKLDAFRAYDAGTGPDLYKVAASGIYRIPVADVSKAQRQIGKVGELALGFQGGRGAFQAMAKAYGVVVGDEQADEIKTAWRLANPEVVGLWHGLQVAALECMSLPPGEQVDVWTYFDRREPGGDWPRMERAHKTPLFFKRSRTGLAMRLPSGRSIVYWSARIKDVMMPWGKMRPAVVYKAEDSLTKQWKETTGYGGIFCENAVQATARDVMAHAWRAMREAGMSPILSVHDEGICLLPKTREAAGGGNVPFYPTAKEAADAVENIMRQRPKWAVGLPIAADSSAGMRYVKA